MNNKIIMSVLAALVLSIGISTMAKAEPYRYGRRGCGPRVAVRVCPPPVFVPRVRVIAPAPVVYRGGYYCRPHYYAHGCGTYRNCGPRRYYR